MDDARIYGVYTNYCRLIFTLVNGEVDDDTVPSGNVLANYIRLAMVPFCEVAKLAIFPPKLSQRPQKVV